MSNRLDLIVWLFIWGITIFITIRNQWRIKYPSVGLAIAYLMVLSMIHWFGGLIYAFPWYSPQDLILLHSGVSLGLVTQGLIHSALGVVGFGVGNILIAPWILTNFKPSWLQSTSSQPHLKLPQTYIFLGLVFYFILTPLVAWIPSVRAIVTSGLALIIVGFCLGCWRAWCFKNKTKLMWWIAAVISLPIITILSLGFIGYGIAATTVVLIFVSSFYRPRWQVIVAFFLAIILGLSVFVTYLRDRGELRAVVWQQQGIEKRVEQLLTTFQQFEIFDPFDQRHLEAIDLRLNQNTLVGRAVEHISHTKIEFAQGKTIWQASLAWIPRIIWPNKPMMAGSGDLVSTYTGMQFAKNTSVGIGQVLEFYVNFGKPGIFIGFLIFGTVLTIIDISAGIRLYSGNWYGFATWFIPGLGMLQPGGSLVEVVASVASSVVLVFILNKFWFHHNSSKKDILSSAKSKENFAYRK